ncbi:MAG: hypothetical protein ACYTG6_17175, partial [Planctomycetota bacterium]
DREGLGWSLLDALVLGKPICARRVGICTALADFRATTDFSRPVCARYELPETLGFATLFERAVRVHREAR